MRSSTSRTSCAACARTGAGAIRGPFVEVIAAASQEVRSGVLYATIIIVLVFLPLFAMSGLEGRLFAPLGIAYIVSILASLLVSITLTPVLSYYLLPAAGASGRDGMVAPDASASAANRALLAWAFERHRARLRRRCNRGRGSGRRGRRACRAPSCRRSTKARSTSACSTTRASRSPESNRLGLIAERLLMSVPEVASVGRRTGRAELDEHAEGVHFSEIDVDLKPSARARERGARRHPRAPGGAAGGHQRRPADRAPAWITCSRASAPRSR